MHHHHEKMKMKMTSQVRDWDSLVASQQTRASFCLRFEMTSFLGFEVEHHNQLLLLLIRLLLLLLLLLQWMRGQLMRETGRHRHSIIHLPTSLLLHHHHQHFLFLLLLLLLHCC